MDDGTAEQPGLPTRGRPVFLSGLVGRGVEVDALTALLEDDRLVTVVGPGGIGKTRLAFEVLQRWVDGRPGWAVELAEVGDPEILGHTVAAAMGIAVMSTSVTPQVLVDHVGDRRALLLLDNCEHLVEACADLVEGLLSGCPGLRVLATSRQSLAVMGERLYPVAGLQGPEAAELFGARARAVLPGWEPSVPEQADVAALCARLDGSPLAIEVAAAQVRTFSPGMILSRILDESGSMGTLDLRRQGGRTTLSACMEWSRTLCTAEEARLWERLAVFSGGFSLEAAEDVCSGDGLERSQVVWALAGLVDKSLVERDVTDRQGRYRMHEIVRQFGGDLLVASGELALWQRRHRDHFVALAERFDREWIGARQHEWISRVRKDHANLGRAFDFSVARADDAPAAMRMAAMLEPYYACSDSLGMVLHWLGLALHHPTGSDRERSEALRFGCHMATILSDAAVAARMYDELAALAERTDDDRVRASALYAATVYLTFRGRAEEATALGADGIRLLEQVGDLNRQVYLCYLLGKACSAAGRLDDAAAAFRDCLGRARPRGERWMSGYATFGLGQVALTAGRLTEANELMREALRVKAEFQDHLGLGFVLDGLAWIAAAQDRWDVAAFLTGAADGIWSSLGASTATMPYLSERRASSLAVSRRALGEDRYGELHGEGSRAPFELVVSVALGDSPLPSFAPSFGLTPREWQIALLISTGATNREIADQLVVSVRTVETHVERVLRKVGVRSRAQVKDAVASR